MELLEKYANLLTGYCLDIKPGDKLYIKSTTLAEPLLKEVYRLALRKGAVVALDLSFEDKNKIFHDESEGDQLAYMTPNYERAMKEYDAYLVIRAPFNLMEEQNVDPNKRSTRSKHLKPIVQNYFSRTGNGELKRTLCQFPTQASAQAAGMSLDEYKRFVYKACHLYADDPEKEWLGVRESQEEIVAMLNRADKVRYKNAHMDIGFSVKDRIWMNSDGRTNMPSGEVFTGPIEDSVNGVAFFDYPAIFMGSEVKGVRLEVKDGEVVNWHAEVGKKVLDRVFNIDGATRFGEVAIGTNYNIQQATKNILFDEKIGGTIHMAVGQSYKQTGGLNKSSIHWDLIADMKQDSRIEVDGRSVYENGRFKF